MRPRNHRRKVEPQHSAIRERFNEVVGEHWGVENRLHWRLDVVMNEDQDRTRLGNGPHNLAVLRHMALNVMQKDGSKGSLRGKFQRAGWNEPISPASSDYFEMRLPWRYFGLWHPAHRQDAARVRQMLQCRRRRLRPGRSPSRRCRPTPPKWPPRR